MQSSGSGENEAVLSGVAEEVEVEVVEVVAEMDEGDEEEERDIDDDREICQR